MFKLVQNLLKCVQMCLNVFKLIQNLFKCVQNLFKCVQTFSKPVQMCSNGFKLVQNLLKWVQMCSNGFKTCSNVSNVFQPVQNLFNCVQNCSKIISLSSARGPTWQAELDLVFACPSSSCLTLHLIWQMVCSWRHMWGFNIAASPWPKKPLWKCAPDTRIRCVIVYYTSYYAAEKCTHCIVYSPYCAAYLC